MNIRLATIGDYVEPVATWNPATKPTNTFSYIDLSAVSQIEKQITSAALVLGSEAPSRARQLIKAGDVLVSTVRPNLNGVALVAEEFDGATASTGFCVLRPRPEKLSSHYLMHWVRSPQFINLMVRQATGASYPAVSDRIVKCSHIPLPPPPEQQRIAAILGKADALSRKRKRGLELIDNLAQSIFLEMFGSLSQNTFGWDTVNIADACELIVDCVNRTAPIVEQVTSYKMIRTTNVRNGRVDLENVRYVSKETFDKWNRRAVPREGDVLLTREAPVGEVGMLKGADNVFLGQRLMLYRPKAERATSEFLVRSFQDRYLKEQFDRMSSGSTVKHLPLPACRAFELRLPPITLQEDFARRLAKLKRAGESSGIQSIRLAQLFFSLQHRAFSGQH